MAQSSRKASILIFGDSLLHKVAAVILNADSLLHKVAAVILNVQSSYNVPVNSDGITGVLEDEFLLTEAF